MIGSFTHKSILEMLKFALLIALISPILGLISAVTMGTAVAQNAIAAETDSTAYTSAISKPAEGTVEDVGIVTFKLANGIHEVPYDGKLVATPESMSFIPQPSIPSFLAENRKTTKTLRIENTSSSDFTVQGVSAKLKLSDYEGQSKTNSVTSTGVQVLDAQIDDFVVPAQDAVEIQVVTSAPYANQVRLNEAGEITGYGTTVQYQATIAGGTYLWSEQAGAGSSTPDDALAQSSLDNIFSGCVFPAPQDLELAACVYEPSLNFGYEYVEPAVTPLPVPEVPVEVIPTPAPAPAPAPSEEAPALNPNHPKTGDGGEAWATYVLPLGGFFLIAGLGLHGWSFLRSRRQLKS